MNFESNNNNNKIEKEKIMQKGNKTNERVYMTDIREQFNSIQICAIIISFQFIAIFLTFFIFAIASCNRVKKIKIEFYFRD